MNEKQKIQKEIEVLKKMQDDIEELKKTNLKEVHEISKMQHELLEWSREEKVWASFDKHLLDKKNKEYFDGS